MKLLYSGTVFFSLILFFPVMGMDLSSLSSGEGSRAAPAKAEIEPLFKFKFKMLDVKEVEASEAKKRSVNTLKSPKAAPSPLFGQLTTGEAQKIKPLRPPSPPKTKLSEGVPTAYEAVKRSKEPEGILKKLIKPTVPPPPPPPPGQTKPLRLPKPNLTADQQHMLKSRQPQGL